MADRIVNLARQLRNRQTDYEARLWQILRDRRFSNFKFVRQCPIGKYIVDFCCRQKKLIIELDGGQHYGDRNIKHDEERDKYLDARGYKLVRIANNELDKNIDRIKEAIYYALNDR